MHAMCTLPGNNTHPVTGSSDEALIGLAVPLLETILAGTGWRIAGQEHGRSVGPGHVAGLVIRLESGQVQTQLVIEAKARPRRSDVEALAEMARAGGDDDAAASVALFAPRITAAMARHLRELDIGYVDLSGACRLKACGLFIERLPPDKPPLAPGEHPVVERFLEGPSDGLTAGSILGVRPVKRHRVLRAMLSHPERKWHQSELAELTGTSIGSHVHLVVKVLQREHYADSEGKGPGKVVFLTRPGDLLDDWAVYWRETWDLVSRTAKRYLSLGPNTDANRSAIVEAAGELEADVGFTLTSGSDYYGSFLRDDVICVYYRGNVAPLAEACGFEQVQRGANVIILPVRDAGILYLPDSVRARLSTRISPSAGPVCPVQLYLDMRAAGGRYAEQAEALREREVGY